MAREMNRFFTCFVGIAFGAMCVVPVGAVTITKAAPVAEQESSAASGASSLVPTVLGLVGGIQQLTAQQKELDAQCVPSNQEITFVNNIMKEWAKTGAMSAEDVKRRLGRSPCTSTSYNTQVMLYASTGQMDICYDTFNDGGMIWDGYPKVGYATYCEDGALQCSNKKTMSDISEIVNKTKFELGKKMENAAKCKGTAEFISQYLQIHIVCKEVEENKSPVLVLSKYLDISELMYTFNQNYV